MDLISCINAHYPVLTEQLKDLGYQRPDRNQMDIPLELYLINTASE